MSAALLEQVINGLMMGSIYVLVALGMVLIYGVMHVVNFAHGVLFTLGGYFAHFFYTRVLDSYVLSIVFSMITLALVGIAIERGVFRPLAGNLRNQVIASLGLILAIENGAVAPSTRGRIIRTARLRRNSWTPIGGASRLLTPAFGKRQLIR